MGIKNVFMVLIACVLLFFVFKVGPIYYKGLLGIRGICAEQIDRYKKYGNEFVMVRVNEQLTLIGISKKNSKYKIKIEGKRAYLDIDYWDTAIFYKDYKKDFKFHHQCYSATDTFFK